MTTAVLNTNIKEIENKTPDVSGSVKKKDYDAEILEKILYYFWLQKKYLMLR